MPAVRVRGIITKGFAGFAVTTGALLAVPICSTLAQDAAAAAPDDRVAGPTGEASAATPPVPALSLAEALTTAARRAVDVEVAHIQVARSEAAERTALAAVLPQLGLSATYTRFRNAIERSGLIVRPEDQVGGALTASETLSARAFHARTIAATTTRLSALQLADTQRRARSSVAHLFFTSLAATQTAELARAQRSIAERQLTTARARVSAGVALPLDASRAELAVLDAGRRLADAEAAVERTEEQLGLALGLDTPARALSTTPPQAPTDRELVARLEQRPDLAAADVSADLADLAVDDAWLRFVPSLVLAWNGTWTDTTTTFSPDPFQWTATATVSVPLYDGGARYAARRDASLALEQALLRKADLTRRVRAELRDGRRRLVTAERALAIAEQAEQVAGQAARAAEAGYGAGATTGAELDDARRDFEEAQLEHVLRALEREVALVDLLSLGGLL